jgi:hypothetical protein
MWIAYVLGACAAVVCMASMHEPTMSFFKTVLYDAPFVLRAWATRMELWNPHLLWDLKIPRYFTDISEDEWARATGLVIMVHGFRVNRSQFNEYAQAIRKSDPQRLMIIPELRAAGDAPLDKVLAQLMDDIQWRRADIPVTWIGISNGARLTLHAIAENWTPEWPATQAHLLAGPLRGTKRANWARDWLSVAIRRLFACDAVLDELVYPSPRVTMKSNVQPTPQQLQWHLHRAHFDYAIAPTFSSVDFDDGHVITHVHYHTGHSGMLPRALPMILATL